MKVLNLETIIDVQSWCKIWPPNGSKHIHAKKKTSLETQRSLQKFLEPDRKPVNTTLHMTRFRGAKLCSKWLQERIDEHNTQSDYKYKSELKMRIQYWYVCVVTLHDYTTDTNDDMTTMIVFHTEHINTNT